MCPGTPPRGTGRPIEIPPLTVTDNSFCRAPGALVDCLTDYHGSTLRGPTVMTWMFVRRCSAR